ncbi:MAG: hypothetical protein P4M11_11665 [Candidatus Pacebacteria bacterium]|nr:hypothetical protein [Candidatus Paceibacterota bacterium]
MLVDEIETLAVMTEDQYIINVTKTRGEEEKPKVESTYKIDLGSVRISKQSSVPNNLTKLWNGTEDELNVMELKKRLHMERKVSLKAATLVQKDPTRISNTQLQAILSHAGSDKHPEDGKRIISLPQWSIYLSSTAPEGEIANFGCKPYEIFIDGQQLDSQSYFEFDTFGYACNKGLSSSFMPVNQDFLIIKNAAKNINFFSVIDGHGYDCQQFHDTLKLYSALMILGDKALPKDPYTTISKALSYVLTLIEESEESAANLVYSCIAVFGWYYPI